MFFTHVVIERSKDYMWFLVWKWWSEVYEFFSFYKNHPKVKKEWREKSNANLISNGTGRYMKSQNSKNEVGEKELPRAIKANWDRWSHEELSRLKYLSNKYATLKYKIMHILFASVGTGNISACLGVRVDWGITWTLHICRK